MGLQICHSDTENQPGEESVEYKQDSSMLKRSTKTGYIVRPNANFIKIFQTKTFKHNKPLPQKRRKRNRKLIFSELSETSLGYTRSGLKSKTKPCRCKENDTFRCLSCDSEGKGNNLTCDVLSAIFLLTEESTVLFVWFSEN